LALIIALIIFGMVVIVHEFGHMYVAKKNGVYVEEFAIGMGPKLFATKKNDTLYTIRLLPIGGYCKMLGDETESNDSRSFSSKKVHQRVAIIVAGAIMNFILAIILQFFLTPISSFSTPIVRDTVPDSPAYHAGLEKDDKILSYNGEKVISFRDLQFSILFAKDELVEIVYEKPNGEKVTKAIRPNLLHFDTNTGEEISKEDYEKLSDKEKDENVYTNYLIGFYPQTRKGFLYESTLSSETQIENAKGITTLNFGEHISYSIDAVVFNGKLVYKSLKLILSGETRLNDFMGPIGMVDMIDVTYEQTKKDGFFQVFRVMLELAILISTNLGVMNLLPIPAVDGGRLVFLVLEALRGKPIPAEKEGMVHFIGFALLMVFALVVAFNDIRRLIGS